MLDSASLDLSVLIVTRRRQVLIDVRFDTDFSRINIGAGYESCSKIMFCERRLRTKN